MIEVRKLNNGATMIMEPTDYVRSAALGIWVRAGASHENDDNSGVSHFIEHMMFKGTSSRNAREIAEHVDRIGGMFNAFTGKEATCYYIKTLSSNIYQGAEILLDMLTDSQFASEEMDKERQVILEEIKMIRDTPDEDVMDMISETVNGENPIGRTILGTPESLAGIDREKLHAYYEYEYSCDSIVIAVAGNFDMDRITELFEAGLGSLRPQKPAFRFGTYPYEQRFQVKVKDIEQTHICLAMPSISLADERYYAFALMNNILGGSMSSRLFQSIREEKGLAYSVASMCSYASASGFFNIYAGVAHEKAEETIRAIKSEVQKLNEDGVTDDELSKAKEQMKSSFIFGLENINTRMFNLGKNKLLLDKVYETDEVIQGFDAVTKEDIREAAALIGDAKKFCGAAVTGRDFDLEGIIKS